MKKTITTAAKFFSLLNLVVAVVTGKEVDSAMVIFNNAWN